MLLAQKTESIILFTDRERRIVWVNDSFSKLTGYSREDALGQNPSFLQGEGTDRETVARIHLALIEGRGIKEIILKGLM